MNNNLETFNYFVDDLLSINENLLKYELDIILMQYLFNTIDLEELKDLDIKENLIAA